MAKTRVILTLITFCVVGFFGLFAIFYARGYRLDLKTLKFLPKGILVVKSNPTGAQIFIDRTLKGATDSNFSLSPATYDLEVKKNGYLPWYKRVTIEKEAVTQINISLFKTAPSLTPFTQNSALSPTISPDLTKIAYGDSRGLWLVETINFPIGFGHEPKRITDTVLATEDSWEFSPSGREILLTAASGTFLLDTGSFTPQAKMVNISSKKESTLTGWQKERQDKLILQEKGLPSELQEILQKKASSVIFSPDESKILYTASASANLTENLIPPVPGASTQKQSRYITIDSTYVYDTKEDRNFLVNNNPNQRIFWLENSNLVLTEDNQIVTMDYDGTNRQTVYGGEFIAPFVFPYINTSKLLILTSLGASSPNLYSLSIK
jgi:hypothetical protein